MGRFKHGTPETSVNSEMVVENLPEDLSKLKILDVDDLLTRIQEVYERIIQESTDPSSFATSLMGSKSRELADNRKKEAEQLWKDGKFREALLRITSSIALAEKDGAELASAYSDRSYFLLKLERYNSCILDVNRATEITDCPAGLKKKLRERKKQCLIMQKNIGTAKEEDLHLEWHKSCNYWKPSSTPLPKTSLKLKVCFDEKQERHLIAIEDIRPGEILSVNGFYVTELNFLKVYTNCSFCLLECDTLIPCSTCTLEMYCSENCRNRAFNLFHQSECKFIRQLYEQFTSHIPFLAVRMFLIGTDQGKQLEGLMKKLKPRDIFVEKYDYHSWFNDYRSTLQIRRIGRVHDDFVFAAVYIIIVLIRSSFFGDFETFPDRLSTVQSYAALLLINHLHTLEMVDSAVEKLHFQGDPVGSRGTERTEVVKSFEPEIIGYGICLFQSSLIKRSCYANTSTFYQNRQRIVFATRAIQRGEELSTSSAIYKFPEWINKYRSGLNSIFACDIDACSTKCPKIELLRYEEIPFSSALDSSYKTKIKMAAMKVHAEIQRTRKQAKVLSNKEMLKFTIKHSNLLCEMLTIPSFDIVLCEQLLMIFMKLLYCDHHRQCKDFSLEGHFNNAIDFIARRIYDTYGIEFAAENQQ